MHIVKVSLDSSITSQVYCKLKEKKEGLEYVGHELTMSDSAPFLLAFVLYENIRIHFTYISAK